MDPASLSRICIPVCAGTISGIEEAFKKAVALADLVEIRLDCVEQSEFLDILQNLEPLLRKAERPVIITYRPFEQGGQLQLDARSRLLFWLFNRPIAEMFDIEFDIATTPALFGYGKELDWSRVICSYHNFLGVPSNLLEIYERIAVSPAGILKFAAQANDVTDSISIFQLLDRALKDDRKVIAIAMGTSGVATRILGPSRGSFLTYGSLDEEGATAPGQISARRLREVYRIDKMNRQTAITGLMGHPVSHSVSPQIHNAAFETTGTDAVYIPFDVKDPATFIRRMVHPRTRELDWNMRGVSITAPHKFVVMDQLDWIAPAAKKIGAVNTIVVVDDVLHGYNTDAAGFLKQLRQKFGDLEDACCAVIGTGGAAHAVVFALLDQLANVTVFARNAARAEELHQRFDVTWQRLDGSRFDGFDLVINATPLGTAGQSESETPATARQLAGARLAYDLVYNPIETLFLREARKAGCETLGGLPMLIAQAAEQFKLWTGREAPEEVMLAAAAQALREG
jgi:3-dehydroquinate dehydratase/shikimate dehydrogenase